MSYASYQAGAPDGVPTDTSNLVPEGTQTSYARVIDGSVSVSFDGSTTQNGVQRLNTGDLGNGQGGITGTARTATGSPRMTAELQPTDRIVVEGMEMTVAMAEKLGMLNKDSSGLYSDAPAEPEAAPPQAPADTAVALPSAAAERDLASLVEMSSPTTQLSVMGQLIEGGELNQNTVNRVASEMGADPKIVGGQISRVVEGFREQAAQSLRALGNQDPEPFFEWARANRAGDLKQAMRNHAMERTAAGYAPIYREYLEHLDEIDPEAVLGAEFAGGITAQKVGKTIVLNIPGKGQVSYRAALKAGLIGAPIGA